MSSAPTSEPARERPRLFDGADVRVTDARVFGSAACLVTFTSWTDEPTLDREGYAERFLLGERLDAVHVISRGNRWWQHAETMPAMAAVRASVAGHARVVTYGSSMGAYAAVRLAGAAGADVVLAMSPQFSILPRVAPFEHRWTPISRSLRPVWEPELATPRPAEAYLVHDPQDLDARHVDLFRRSGLPFTPVRLRGAGHQTAVFLQELQLLKPLVRQVAAGPPDVAALEHEAWRRRRGSPQHLLTLAERAHAPELKLAAARRALALIPESPVLLSRLGDALVQAGRPQDALAAHARALELSPGWGPLVLAQAKALEAAGRRGEARDALRALVERTGVAEHAWALADLDRDGEPGRGRGVRRVRRRDPGVRPVAGAVPFEVGSDEAGCVLCGPHLVLRPGRYEVSFGVEADPAPRRPLSDLLPVATVEVSLSTGPRLARRDLSRRHLRRVGGRVVLTFVLRERAACEFRVHVHGRAALRVDPARPLRRAGPPPA